MSEKYLIRLKLAAALVASLSLCFIVTLSGTLTQKNEGRLTISVIDVGQGDSIFIETPSGKTMLVDGGGQLREQNEDAPTDIGEKRVLPFLRSRGINSLDYVVATHPHGDHVGGLPAVLRSFHVSYCFDSRRTTYQSESYERFLDAEKSSGAVYSPLLRGSKIDFGDGVKIDVLNPPASGMPYGVDTGNDTTNNYSAVLLLTYGKTRILLDGDAEEEAEKNMIAAYKGKLHVDALKCGHHGSSNATSDEWLDELTPKWAFISCGLHNIYGHPNRETLMRLNAHHVNILRTDHDGSVTMASDGNTVSVSRENPPK
jgi:beta-lactamase superfamily II metal-dependent hydrolase